MITLNFLTEITILNDITNEICSILKDTHMIHLIFISQSANFPTLSDPLNPSIPIKHHIKLTHRDLDDDNSFVI
jgi:tetratricopeptide (TPR) repeat protein